MCWRYFLSRQGYQIYSHWWHDWQLIGKFSVTNAVYTRWPRVHTALWNWGYICTFSLFLYPQCIAVYTESLQFWWYMTNFGGKKKTLQRVNGNAAFKVGKLKQLYKWASSWDYGTFCILHTHMRSHLVGIVSDFWLDPSSTSILHVCKQRRL